MYSLLNSLREHSVPVSVREWLDFHATLRNFSHPGDLHRLHILARLTLVKDERHYDRFDLAFAAFIDSITPYTEDAAIAEEDVGLGVAEAFARGREQHEQDRHQADERECLVSTDGDPIAGLEPETSEKKEEGSEEKGEGEGQGGDPGESGEQVEEGEKSEGDDGEEGPGASEIGESGERKGEVESPRQRAEALWLDRQFEDYDESVELGTRTFRMALRRLRQFARESADLELDLNGTIAQTARQGWLDIRMVPERRNAIRVLLLLDVGGSMDAYVEETRQLFVAAASEFRHLETFYFHNCLYNAVWRSNARGNEERTSLTELLRRYGPHYKVVMVGDANMSSRELTEIGGSVERYNPEPGEVYLTRLASHFRRGVWLNPEPQKYWLDIPSCRHMSELLDGEMFPMSTEGITAAMRSLLR